MALAQYSYGRHKSEIGRIQAETPERVSCKDSNFTPDDGKLNKRKDKAITMKININERVKMVKAMEYIARQVNDEELFMDYWLTTGVADGDIKYGDLELTSDDYDNLDYYMEEENFADLMRLFLKLMAKAYKSGGLYCDNIVSR